MKNKSSKLKKQLDILSKQFVRARDEFTCQRCLKVVSGSNCHVSHVIPVSAGLKLRWDELNMKVLCYHDHMNWWHKNPMEAWDWFSKKFPDRWEYLQENRGIKQFKEFELEEMIEEYKDKLVGIDIKRGEL